jgi:hypothetical protein
VLSGNVGTNYTATDEIYILIPVEVVETPTAGASDDYTVTITYTNSAGAEAGPFTPTVSFVDQLGLMDWDDGYFEDAGADGRVETDDRGKYFPDGATSTIVDDNTLPDYLIDEQTAATVVEEGVITVANWDLYTSNAWGTGSSLGGGPAAGAATNLDDMEYYLWASQSGDLGKITAATGQRVVDYDAVNPASEWPYAVETRDMFDALNPLNATDPQTGIVFAERLAEGDWYFYITSSATGDWALGRSDTIEVRHRPVFADYAVAAGVGASFDDNFDGVYSMAADGTELALTLESGGSIGFDGTFDPANNQPSVDIFWDIEDVDDNAYVHVFRSTNGALTSAAISVSGTDGSEWVDSLAGAVQIHSDTLREESATAATTYDTYTSPAVFETAGLYYFYVVLNDQKNQTLQVVDETAGPAAVPVTVTHAPFLAFHPYNPGLGAALSLDSKTDEYFTISWGNPPVSGPTTNVDGDQDADAAGTATIQLYAVEEDGAAGVGSGLFGAVAINPISRTLLDAEVTGGNATLLATITDDGDDQSDNRYEWDFRATALPSGENYYIYGVMTHGSDLIITQLNTDGTPGALAGPQDDTPITFAHSDYIRPITPYAGPPVELDGNDMFELRWEAFNTEPTGTQGVQAVLVAEGAANPGNADYTVWAAAPYNTADFAWLLPPGTADGGIPGANEYSPAAAGAINIDISDYTATALGAGAPAAGNYEVWYFFSDDAAAGDFGATDLAVKAPGMVYLTGQTTTEYHFEIQPQKAVMTTGDILTFSVYAKDDASAENPNMVSLFIDIPEASNFTIVDQDAVTAGTQPFSATANFTGTELMNTLTTNGDTYELNYLERIAGVGTVNLAALTLLATFQVEMTSTITDPFQDVELSFSQADPRITNLYDADGSPQSTSIPPIANTLRLGQQGKLDGFVDIEGLTDQGEEVSFYVAPTGALDGITDATYLAANSDADGSDGVQITLGAGGSYTLEGIPNGEYDIRLRKSGYLDVIYANKSVSGLETVDLHFTGGNKLFGGDAAGFDHDGDASTFSQPDNRVDSDDTDAISTAFGASSGDATWNAYADIDGSGTVGVNDLFLASRNLGTDGDGAFYKEAPIFDGDNGNAMVMMAEVGRSAEGVTYAISASDLSSLSAYEVDMFISSDWELVGYSDLMANYSGTVNLGRHEDSRGLFAAALIGRIGMDSRDADLLRFTVRAKVANPEAPSLSSAILVDGNGDLNSAILGVSEAMPTDFALSQNYPNPFNPVTNISFSLPVAGNVKLVVYNLLGQEVRTLVAGAMEAGTYRAKWNSEDNLGRKVSSGMYFYRLQVDNRIVSAKKMVLLQ